jgi:hypothetical protein
MSTASVGESAASTVSGGAAVHPRQQADHLRQRPVDPDRVEEPGLLGAAGN